MQPLALESARILVVDDEPANLRLIERILREAGYAAVRTTSQPSEVLGIFVSEPPDLILLDLHMPTMDGFAVLEEITPWIEPGCYLPILMLTGDTATDVKERALAGGAKDFLNKPFSASEVLLRIRNLLETRFLHLQLKEHNDELEHRVRERTEQLEDARLEILERLARAAEYRDDDTGEHTRRVGLISRRVALELGLPVDEAELISRAAPLHDIGKIGIPDGILLKPGKLTQKEIDVMRTHTLIGQRILSGSNVPVLQVAATIALTHHERWDGCGYPEGLSRESIPLSGRIIAVVDVFDALTHDRPYKKAWPLEAAMEQILSSSETQFDPAIVDAFQRVVGRSLSSVI